MYEVYGYQTTACIFAVLINLFMFVLWIFRRLQNAVEDFFEIRKSPLVSTEIRSGKLLFLSLIENLIEVNNESRLFPKPQILAKRLKYFAGLFVAQVIYGSVIWCVLGLDSITSDNYKCRRLRVGTEYLLDSTVNLSPSLNMSFDDLYRKRKEHARQFTWEEDNVKALLARDLNTEQKFQNISDLIEGFNKNGFHDICNALGPGEIGTGFENILHVNLLSKQGSEMNSLPNMLNLLLQTIQGRRSFFLVSLHQVQKREIYSKCLFTVVGTSS